MTDKEHDVNYADPEEESKGTFEQKVCNYTTYCRNVLTSCFVFRLTCQR